MSRTDKDAPWWAQTNLYEPTHGRHCPEQRSVWRRWPLLPCNLPPEPVRKSPRGYTWRSLDCRWEPCWPSWMWKPWHHTPDREDRRLMWWGPDRSHVRDTCRKALKEYNGSADVDTLPPQYYHRHHPHNGWWD